MLTRKLWREQSYLPYFKHIPNWNYKNSQCQKVNCVANNAVENKAFKNRPRATVEDNSDSKYLSSIITSTSLPFIWILFEKPRIEVQ